MTIAVDMGRKATKTNKQTSKDVCFCSWEGGEDLEEQLLLIQNEEGMGYIEGITAIALVKMFVFVLGRVGGGRGPGGTATVDTE